MIRSIACLVFCLLFIPQDCSAQAGTDPFSRESKWTVQESWNNDKLVYTFRPNGTFQSSKGPNGHGLWMRHDTAIVMIWTGYRNETYVGVIGNDEIRGSGFFRDGKPFGTFELKLMTQPGSR